MSRTLTLYHGSTRPIPELAASAAGPGVHFGSLGQARMRNPAYIHEAEITIGSCGRTRDRQSWGETARRARSGGHDAMIYLNRYEGMPIERLQRLLADGHGDRLDSMPDRAFRKLVPEAEDSLLVVDPAAIRLIRILDREGAVVWAAEPGPETETRPASGLDPEP